MNFPRRFYLIILDFLLGFLAILLSLIIIKPYITPEHILKNLWRYLIIDSWIIAVLNFLGVYKISLRYFGFRDLIKSLQGAPFFALIIYPLTLSWRLTILIIVFFYLFFLITRSVQRFYLEYLKQQKEGKKTLIVGLNDLAEHILRQLLKNDYGYRPVGIIAPDRKKIGLTLLGIPILGTFDEIEEIIKDKKIEAVIVATPQLKGPELKNLFNKLKAAGVEEIKVVPRPDKLPDKPFQVKDLKDISLEDLLFREPVRISKDKLHEFFKNKTILVTGAAGSIGSEIVRQLLEFSPKEVIALETDETELHNLLLKLKTDKVKPFLADVRDYEKLKQAFEKWNIDYVFHAAAYKHVPMIEAFPEEAVKTNIFGTYNLARLAVDYGVKKFVNISTDKAVNPTSIMGATKRFAEIICSSFNRLGKTKFISVRFGNVLGSRGSVIPIFLEQIKEGGPVTVTHPEMKRYFMTISEAVSLVLEAAYMGKGGEVFVLDMGQPVKILDLAETLIRLHGLEPYKDIEIKFIGLRPGEKLFEELLTAEEGTDKTEHERIYIARKKEFLEFEELQRILERLKECAKSSDKNCIRSGLEEYITFYKPSS